MIPRLNTKLWLDAHIRACFAADMPAFVTSKGDAERGGLILKINGFDKGVRVLERATDFDGHSVWRTLGPDPNMDERDADARISKRRSFDDDLWVVEIEDRFGTYAPDAPIENL